MCPSQGAHQTVRLRSVRSPYVQAQTMLSCRLRKEIRDAASRASRRPELAARPPVQGDIGFVGLGHMGTAMAANLVAAGRRVIAYVRRPDQCGQLEALGLRPTTDIDDLLDCAVVISMSLDD